MLSRLNIGDRARPKAHGLVVARNMERLGDEAGICRA